MGERDLEYCDANFRYSIAEEDGEMRFTMFEVTGPLGQTAFGAIVKDYFTKRPLRDVRHEDIEAMRDTGDIRCLKHIVEHVLKLRESLGM